MRLYFISFIFFLSSYANLLIAQTPVYTNTFPASKAYHTSPSLFGTALDLTKTSSQRTVIQQPYPLSASKQSFSVLLWVKADRDLQQSYTILSSYHENKDSATGWKIGVQVNGAWCWKITDEKNVYDYLPTVKRQTIKDGNWHQLAFTYDAAKEEAWLFYDGLNVAILYIPGLKNLATEQLLIGGDIKGDIDQWETFNGCIDEVQLYNEVLSPSFVVKSCQNKFSAKTILKPGKTLSVMNYNIWHGGRETGKETGVNRIAEIIKNSGVDIISMQETYGSGPAIADALGFYFYLRSSNISIMSRYPIEETIDGYKPFYNGGAFIQLPDKRRISFFANWLNYPIDYWDMLQKNKPINKEEWLSKQEKGNAQTLNDILKTINPALAMTDSIPLIFCGDFNSGSHLDWIASTKQLNNGYVIPFPGSILMYKKGFKDSFRELHPDPLQERGITWTPQFPEQFQDRIDYIYYKGKQIKPLRSFTISTHHIKYPSDHAAVVTVFELKK